MANNRILRFHAPDKVFHSVNAITWFALLFTGVYVYFCEPEAACAEATIPVPIKAKGGQTVDIRICVVNGANQGLEEVLHRVRLDKNRYHFIEVMNCPGGCVNGGGQPVRPVGTSWLKPTTPLPLRVYFLEVLKKMFSQNYSYAERPAALILGRRGFLKVSGLCIGAAVVCGWAIGDMVSRRSSIILARQAGLYQDDKLCQAMGLASSHNNPVVMSVYKTMKAKPVDHTMHELLHTHFYLSLIHI